MNNLNSYFAVPIFVFVVFLSLIILLLDDIKVIGQIYFYIISISLIADIYKSSKVKLIHIWNIAFCFIILSEIFSPSLILQEKTLSAVKYLIIANNMIFLGYFFKFSDNYNISLIEQNKTLKYSNLFAQILIFTSLLVFIFFNISNVLIFYGGGRLDARTESSFVLFSVINSIGYFLPAIIAYFYITKLKKPIFTALLISSPVFFIQFVVGTRFPLLFSVLGFLFIVYSNYKNSKWSFKNKVIISSLLILLFLANNLMRGFRNYGIKNYDFSSYVSDNNNTSSGLADYILSYGSNEGVVDMTSLLFLYFDTNDFHYGKSSSFILYFWVPRSIWPEKPVMLGQWFIRNYRTGFSSGHSTSFGFTGDLYVDFGLFSLIPVFFIGRVIKIGDNYVKKVILINDHRILIAAMLFPYVFFFVRSPLTATISMISIIFYYYVFKKFL